MAENVGEIRYISRIDTDSLRKDASTTEQIADNTARNTTRSYSTMASNLGQSFGNIADTIGTALKTVAIGALTGSVGIGAMVKASWDQVDAVQQATVGLKAYEKNADAVNGVLSELVSYARSDMGVLFNRKDLFQSAQMLKLNGVETSALANNVKILSRSVGLGLGNWQDLNAVVGRVVSTGRLSGIEFDQLTQYGYKLDKSLRNTNISATALFEALDKGIPTDALAGQANTIQGMGIRLQTAFRGLGDAILGVDRDTGQFVEGGLGSRLVDLLGKLTEMLKNPALREGFAKIGQGIADFAENALPKVIDGFTWMLNNMDTIVAGVKALAAAFIAAKAASLLLSASPIGLIATAIVGLIAGLVYLQEKYQIFTKMWQALKPIIDPIVALFKNLWTMLMEALAPAFEFVSRHLETFKNIALVLLAVAITPLAVGIAALIAVIAGFVLAVVGIAKTIQFLYNSVINFFTNLPTMIGNAISAVVNWFKALPEQIAYAFGFIVGLLVKFYLVDVPAFVQGVINWFAALPGNIMSALSSLWSAISNAFSAAFNWVRAEVPRFIGNVVQFFRDLPGKIVGALGNLGSLLYNSGRDLVNGLINGVKNMWSSAVNIVKDLGSAMSRGFKSALGIQSPSKVFAEYGKNIMEGLAIGVDNNAGLATGAIDNVANSLIPNANAGLSAVGGLSGIEPLTPVVGSKTNIGQLIINEEIDGRYWLNKLSGDQTAEINGLTPKVMP